MGYSDIAGWRATFEFDFINQDQLRSGTSSISNSQVAAINDAGGSQEVEKQTINRYFTAGISYRPNGEWNFNLLVPYIDRSHSTYGASMNPLTPDKVSSASVDSLGDIRFITSYQGFLPTHNLGFQLGLILPTGDYGGPNAAGTGTVGRNPVAFNVGPNSQIPSPGNLLDTSLQAGAGATDLIVGAYYYQAVSQNFDAFINGQFQAALWHKLDQPGEDYRPGNLVQRELRRALRGEPNDRAAAAIQHHQQAHGSGSACRHHFHRRHGGVPKSRRKRERHAQHAGLRLRATADIQ